MKYAENTVRRDDGTKVFVSLLFLGGVWVSYVHLRSGEFGRFVAFLPVLCVVGLFVVGEFEDVNQEHWYRAAVGTGITLWGTVGYLFGGGWWELLLTAGGLVLLGGVSYDYLQPSTG